jgi:hypothetical protein
VKGTFPSLVPALRPARTTRRLERASFRSIVSGREIAMPVFHFDIADGVRLEDPVGLDCASEHDARKTADLIARQIAADLGDDRDEERSVAVIDEAGTEIYLAPVRG